MLLYGLWLQKSSGILLFSSFLEIGRAYVHTCMYGCIDEHDSFPCYLVL